MVYGYNEPGFDRRTITSSQQAAQFGLDGYYLPEQGMNGDQMFDPNMPLSPDLLQQLQMLIQSGRNVQVVPPEQPQQPIQQSQQQELPPEVQSQPLVAARNVRRGGKVAERPAKKPAKEFQQPQQPVIDPQVAVVELLASVTQLGLLGMVTSKYFASTVSGLAGRLLEPEFDHIQYVAEKTYEDGTSFLIGKGGRLLTRPRGDVLSLEELPAYDRERPESLSEILGWVILYLGETTKLYGQILGVLQGRDAALVTWVQQEIERYTKLELEFRKLADLN
jgi:hypothetical protein